MITRSKVGIFKPKAFTTNTDIHSFIPTTVTEALHSPHWFQAMRDEYNALIQNKTWLLTTLPNGSKVVGCEWVFKNKYNVDGSFQRHKARLVAKGFNQTASIDYTETYSPVVKPATIYVLSSPTSCLLHGPYIKLINNALLNGDLRKDVYMQEPPGFESSSPNLVCKLQKAIYGLKQASRSWFEKLRSTLESFGFNSTRSDTSLFVKFHQSFTIFILIYVDDIVITGSSPTQIQALIQRLGSFFALKDLGHLHYFLGIEVQNLKDGNILLSQTRYINDLLQRTHMTYAHPIPTPMQSALRLSKDASVAVQDPTLYYYVVGALQYILVTRPELSYAINKAHQFMQNTQEHHWKVVKRILRYLTGTTAHGLLIRSSPSLDILAFSDADWRSDVDDRKSTTDIVFILELILLHGPLINKKLSQGVVQRQSTEA